MTSGAVAERVETFGPWNPGLKSQIPGRFLPLATVFRPENVSNGYAEIRELADFSGLSAFELARFRPERLAVHELLVRVTADISVPDGPNYEDLGISFREICSAILDRYIAPRLDEVRRRFDRFEARAGAVIDRELSERLFPREVAPRGAGGRPRIMRWLGLPAPETRPTPPRGDLAARAARAIEHWGEAARTCADPLEAACFEALRRTVTALVGHRGRLAGDKAVMRRIAGALACNSHGSEVVGRTIEPFIREAVEREGYRLLPAQPEPTVMNAKGASASGKSTIRPQQRDLAARLGVDWQDFALISPDIWRKFLLDYGSLGEAYKYAGALTGHELEIVDRKLDRYMAQKSARGTISHLLIDRFRFDSFLVDHDEASNLLSRFGHRIFMFFMITPPHMTVERAWTRGLKFGRYKSVDDLLYHNVEAFTGMPQLFLSWAGMTKKRVHYEFLDNSVAEGRPPRTVAFGWNGVMTILDIGCLLDIERYRKVNINAAGPDEVYEPEAMDAGRNAGFLRECARHMEAIIFADHATGEPYARMESGKWVWWNEARAAAATRDAETRAGLEALGWGARSPGGANVPGPGTILEEKRYTLGDWASAAP